MADTTQQATAQQETLAEAMRIVRCKTIMLPTRAHLKAMADVNADMLEALKFAQEILKDQAERFHQDCRCQLCESCLQMVEKTIAKGEGR